MPEYRVTSYKEAEATLKIPSLRQSLYDAGAILLENTVVNLHGDEHKTKRNVVQSVFTRDFFRHYQNHVFPRALNETLAPCLEAGCGDLVVFSYRVLVNLVADSAGVDRQFSQADTDRLFTLIQAFSKAPAMGQLVGGDRNALMHEVEKAIADFNQEFYIPSVTRRRELLASAAADPEAGIKLPNDILTAMLKAYPDGKLSEHDLMRDTAFFILAGTFTVANSLMNVVHEILTWCEKDPGRRTELMANPRLLQRCIWESVRLHPASPIAKRRVTCPVHLPNADDASTDDGVVVEIAVANRDTSIFGEDADEYNPFRTVQGRTPRFGLSFGSGPHACLGRILAAGLEIGDVSAESEAETEYGTLFMITRQLLASGIRKDPDHPPTVDESTMRRHWHQYAFLIDKEAV